MTFLKMNKEQSEIIVHTKIIVSHRNINTFQRNVIQLQ